MWIDSVEDTNENANLALSEEEAAILRNQEARYPLFINGRPGSGKSTVLQYLFAEHLYPLIVDDFNIGYPLYLTYNNDLLEIAKANVFSILTSNAEKLSRPKRITEEKAKEYISHCFVNFRDFLISLLPTKQNYLVSKYIGFAQYKALHEGKFASNPDEKIRKFPAELAWHIIRTYIKGSLVEEGEYLDPEAFSDLPEKQKSVNEENFKIVYEKIWPSYK